MEFFFCPQSEADGFPGQDTFNKAAILADDIKGKPAVLEVVEYIRAWWREMLIPPPRLERYTSTHR
jgi:hypothetical protein